MKPRLALLLLVLTLFGCASTPPLPTGATQNGEGRRVLVLDHGLHAGLQIARGDLLRTLPALAESLGDGD